MTSFESPLLYSGTTLAFFHDLGNCAVSMLVLHMFTMCGAMISALSFSTLQLIPSSPVAFAAGIALNCFRTNSIVIFGSLKYAFSDLLREIKFRNFA